MSAANRVGSQDTNGAVAVEWTCPTCGARQVLSEECRRCRCDLSLLRRVLECRRQLHGRCLALLRQRRLKRATETARQYRQLSNDEAGVRLLAVCHLLQSNFPAALRLYASFNRDPTGSASSFNRDPTASLGAPGLRSAKTTS